jgi:DNA-binding GntR family transcriptional regulator
MATAKPPVLAVVSKASLRSEAARAMREAILSGRFTQGERLNEAQLSQQLGVSRGPLREAFRQLEEEGLLISKPHRGTYVALITTEELIEVLTLREHLEPFAMQSALTRGGLVLLRDLSAALRDMYKAAAKDDAGAVADAHTRFHSVFYIHAEHRLLRTMWDRLVVPLRLYLRIHQRTFPNLKDVAKEHERLLELVQAGETGPLITEIRHHLHVNMRTLLAAVSREEKRA